MSIAKVGSFLAISSALYCTATHAQIATVPPDLIPGDQYRLVFLTKDSVFTATSTNILDYDAGVTSQANSSPELAALGTTWRVIGSTSTIDAKIHTGTDDSPVGPNGVPIYRLDGVIIATDYDDLWDGFISNPLNVTQDGNVPGTCPGAWTGTGPAGIGIVGNELGAPSLQVIDGSPSRIGGGWIQTNPFLATSLECLYAISDVLTVPGAGVLDTLEDIGPDGTPITSRTIGGVTVSISTASGKALEARTYFDGSPNAFGGAGGGANAPASPGNVSLTRFISTVDRDLGPNNCFPEVAPVIFDFSSPVQSFGLTTIDLLEGNGSLIFRAYDASENIVAEQTRTGPQGGSGLDLDWLVEAPNIAQVQLLGTISCGVGGYGLDDFVLEVTPTKIVSIDVKPNDSPECGGVIPVAVLGSESFDVSQIDPSTLSFEGLSVKEKGNGTLSCNVEDVNLDGYADYVCQYRNGLAQGTLIGELLDGTPIEGDGLFCVKN